MSLVVIGSNPACKDALSPVPHSIEPVPVHVSGTEHPPLGLVDSAPIHTSLPPGGGPDLDRRHRPPGMGMWYSYF